MHIHIIYNDKGGTVNGDTVRGAVCEITRFVKHRWLQISQQRRFAIPPFAITPLCIFPELQRLRREARVPGRLLLLLIITIIITILLLTTNNTNITLINNTNINNSNNDNTDICVRRQVDVEGVLLHAARELPDVIHAYIMLYHSM